MLNELEDAINDVLNDVDESDEFKRKLKVYLRNSFANNASDNDLEDIINLIKDDKTDET
jgi:hypothetical protein